MVAFGTTVMVGPRRWGDVARAAESAGFESVWVPEHLIMPVTMTGAPNTPHEGEPPISATTPAFDPWVQIANMAAQTTTLRFGTNVYNVGLRHPFVTARSVTTVDNVSGGRLEFGIGASWLSQEWEAMELPFDAWAAGRRDHRNSPAALQRRRRGARRGVLPIPARRLPPQARSATVAPDAHRRRFAGSSAPCSRIGGRLDSDATVPGDPPRESTALLESIRAGASSAPGLSR